MTNETEAQKKRRTWPIVAAIALAVVLVAGLVVWFIQPKPSTPSPTPSASQAATATPTPSASKTPIASATPSPSATGSATPTPTPSATPTLDTSKWPKSIDCSIGTPPPEFIALCAVAHKTQVQVVEACKAAALGTMWDDSPNHKFGVKDPNLAANIKTCIGGSGLKNDPGSNILGYPLKGKPRVLRYIAVLGIDASVDEPYAHAFNASGSSSDIGFLAFNEDSVLNKITSFYEDFDVNP